MKTKFLLSLILGTTLTVSAELVETWSFSNGSLTSDFTTYNYDGDPSTAPTPRHIGGTDVGGSAYNGWNARATEGAELGTAAAGSTRFGVTDAARTAIANNGSTNAYYGATGFSGVPWAANAQALANTSYGDGSDGGASYYKAAASENDIVRLQVKITDIDFGTTTGNSNNNAAFRYTLWDKATQMANGRPTNQTGYMGLQIMDSSASDRLQLALVSSNGTILSGGQAVTGGTAAADNIGYNRTRIGWLTSNGTLTDSTDYTFTLDIDLAAGSWSAQINDQDAETGTFETDDIQGIDRYQTAFTQWSSGDYIDLDEISVSVIPEPASVSMIALAGGSIMMLRRRFAR